MEQERIIEFVHSRTGTDILQNELLKEYQRRGWRLVQVLGEEQARIMSGEVRYLEVILEKETPL
jgi:hypothetical protein